MLYVTVAALVSLLVSIGMRGNLAAIAIAVSIGCLLLTLAVHSLTFLFGWVLTGFFRRDRAAELGSSPFVSTDLPSQVVPPRTSY